MSAITIPNTMFKKKDTGSTQKIVFKIPGINYSFQNQNFITFEGNSYFKDNILFAAYCDFETSCSKTGSADIGTDEMYLISYAPKFAFYHKLNRNRIIVKRNSTNSWQRHFLPAQRYASPDSFCN